MNILEVNVSMQRLQTFIESNIIHQQVTEKLKKHTFHVLDHIACVA